MIVPEGVSRGATWGSDGTIIFATSTVASGLQRVSDGGGEITVLTKPNRERGELDHLWPEFLPGGKAVLFTITAGHGGLDNAQIAVLDLRTVTSKVLLRERKPRALRDDGASGLRLHRDVARRALRPWTAGSDRDARASAPGGGDDYLGAADVAVAANGSLVYVPGSALGRFRDRRIGGS